MMSRAAVTKTMNPDEDDRLNPTDRKIVEKLRDGRENRGSLADALDKDPEYVGERLKWLREWGYVEYYHERTGLYEMTDEAAADDAQDSESSGEN
jgi:DNA-binding transcriptional ArsR family regulator